MTTSPEPFSCIPLYHIFLATASGNIVSLTYALPVGERRLATSHNNNISTISNTLGKCLIRNMATSLETVTLLTANRHNDTDAHTSSSNFVPSSVGNTFRSANYVLTPSNNTSPSTQEPSGRRMPTTSSCVVTSKDVISQIATVSSNDQLGNTIRPPDNIMTTGCSTITSSNSDMLSANSLMTSGTSQTTPDYSQVNLNSTNSQMISAHSHMTSSSSQVMSANILSSSTSLHVTSSHGPLRLTSSPNTPASLMTSSPSPSSGLIMVASTHILPSLKVSSSLGLPLKKVRPMFPPCFHKK